VVSRGPVSPGWQEIEADEFPEKPNSLEGLETGTSSKNLKKDLQSADSTKAQT